MNRMFRQSSAIEGATSQSSAAAIDETPCPVAELAREAQAIYDAYTPIEVAEYQLTDEEDNHPQKIYLKLQTKALADRQENTEERASHLLASSAVGAMFQLGLISYWAESIHEWVPADCEEGRRCKEWMKGIDRMLYSVQAYIQKVSGENPDEACGEAYLSRRLNPHRLINEALAAGNDQPATPRQRNIRSKSHA